jgi:hypothetical protein
MGSPVSVVLAELVMQTIEKQSNLDPTCVPLIWKRYLDDVITILPIDKVGQYLQHMN